jgi:sialidase-1
MARDRLRLPSAPMIGNNILMKLLFTALFTAQLAAQAAAPAFSQTNLWTAGVDGYHTYRIPSLLVTPKGTVLAFCEGRKTGGGDHGDLDLVMKRSTDGGRTWSAQQVVYEEGGDAKITIGNPCPVVDESTGTIWLPFNRDNKAVLITSSTDEGVTWSKPVDISSSTMKSSWDWVATGPGIGIQLQRGPHKGRLVIPSDHKIPLADKKLEWNSHMMFSDDHGKTWQISTPISAGGNECQVIERMDGSLLVNTRMQGNFEGFRGIATSKDGGATWSGISQEKQIPCPKCQGSLIRYSWSEPGHPGMLLASNPHPPASADGKPASARVRLTVRLSLDDGTTWTGGKTLNAGPSAYSNLARLEDGTILCLYEGGEKRAYETIRIARFNLAWVVDGQTAK